MKTKLKEFVGSLLGWFWFVLAMAIFAVVTALLGKWMQDKVWIIFILDGLFCLCLWLLFGQTRNFSHGRRRLSDNTMFKLALLILAMTLILFLLAAVTLGLFDVLLVRLNVVLFIVSSFATIYLSFERRGIFD